VLTIVADAEIPNLALLITATRTDFSGSPRLLLDR
jgi:hypothetical protein